MNRERDRSVEPALFDMNDGGAYLGRLSPWTLRRKIYRGEIVGVKAGGRLLVEKVELDKYIARSRTKKD
jgi:hypothetical protein